MKEDSQNNKNKSIYSDLPEEYGEKVSIFSREIWTNAIKYLIPLIIVAVIGGGSAYNTARVERLNSLQAEQRSSVLIGTRVLLDDISGFVHDIKYFDEIVKSRSLFNHAGDVDPQVKDELTKILLRSLDAYKRYDKIRILDIDGMEVIRVNYNDSGSTIVPDTDLQNLGDRYYFTETMKLKPEETLVTSMDLNIEYNQVEQPNKPTIRISTPIENKAGEKVGMIVLNYYADIVLDQIRSLKPDFEIQQLTLLNSQGYWLLGPEADMEWGFMYPDKKSEIFGNYHPIAWEEISTREQGSIITPNGSFSFEKIHPPAIEGVHFFDGENDYFWVMVSRIAPEVLSVFNLSSMLTIFGLDFFIVTLILIIILLNTKSTYALDEKNAMLRYNNDILNKLYAELEINEERGRLAIEGSGDGVWDWWIQTGEMKFSKLYMEMLGYEENELPQHANTWVESVHPEDYARVEERLKDHFAELLPLHEVELRLRCKDGLYKWILCRGSVVERDKERNPVRMIGIHTDITKRKELEEEIKVSRENEKKANSAKSEFLSNMSHEIRTPLNAIVGFTDLALKTDLTSQQSNYLNKIKVSSSILLGIIGDILDISKLEAGKVKLEITRFEIEELLHNVIAQISTLCQEKGIELILNIAEDVPVSFKGDSLRLGQVLTNIIGNAIKFTNEGEICINIKLLKNGGSNALLQFSVSDNGIGMTEEQVSNLFQPFNQAETSTTRIYGGTGLGLSICKNLVQLMGGEIWVESEKGKGSIFYFTVRLENLGDKRLLKYKNAFKMWNMKILVVDDSRENLEIIKDILTGMSFDVTTCTTGEEAISIIQKMTGMKQYDLVIMDWKMPKMDGIETSRKIKELFSSQAAPAIIMLTAYSSPTVLTKARELGLEAVLYKPVLPSLLLNTIMQIFGKDEFTQTETSLTDVFESGDLDQLNGVRVLLVEDNLINQEVAQEILQGVGMTVAIANNGKVATEMVNSGSYDIILMDVQMPVMNGYDATKEIRNNPVFSKLPIIAMTANSLKGEKEKCIQAGMNDYVSKPIDTTLLYRTIAHWLPTRQTTKPDNELIEYINKPGEKVETIVINDAMPNLNGINVQSALSRLGGNQKLFRKLLVQFRKTHQDDIRTIREALQLNDHETAGRMIHTIKGAAGNIGAEEVCNASAALEAVTHDFKNGSVEPLLGQLEKAMELVFNSVGSMVVAREKIKHEENDEVSVEDLLPSLEELKQLIGENDLAASDFLDSIISRCQRTCISDKIAQIKDLVDEYDYIEALKILNATIGIAKECEQ